MNNVRELIETRASELGEKVYLAFGDQEITYAQINHLVNQVAAGFRGIGVGKGDRVALLVKNAPEFIYVWWAILKLGAVMVPVNLRLTAREVVYIINHSGAKVVVLGGESMQVLPDLRAQCRAVENFLAVCGGQEEGLNTIEEFYGLSPDLEPQPISMEDNAVILYTSGTTGFPKGVVHTHGNYLRTAASFVRTCGLTNHDRLLTANPLFHVNAQFYSAMGTLMAGATFILMEKFSASRMWDWTRQYRANKLVLLLALTTILYNRPARPDDADNPVDLIVAGGAPKGRYQDFEKRFGVKLQTLYSLTEAPLAVMSPLDRDCVEGAVGVPMQGARPGLINECPSINGFFAQYLRYAQKIILGISNICLRLFFSHALILNKNPHLWMNTNEVNVLDESDHECLPGAPGEIVIRNQAIMKEYLKSPAETASALKGGWLHTGDRGTKDKYGWLFFLGRYKDMIRKKGENISSAEVEAALVSHEAVAETAVIGVTPADAAGEEEIMAFIVWHQGRSRQWDHLIAHCEAGLADFKVPRFWLAVDQLPKNSMNRVVKGRLKESDAPEETPGTYDCLKGEVK